MKKLSKELLGLAGEYAVASELCKRGLYSQLTLGHHKRTDILVETATTMLRIQVKAKQGKAWPGVAGLHRADDFLVLVDFTNKQPNERPDFFIVNFDDWKWLVAEAQQRRSIEVNELFEVTYKSGWHGLNIKMQQVAHTREQWHKITLKIDSSNTEA